jgi:hypothetical protein
LSIHSEKSRRTVGCNDSVSCVMEKSLKFEDYGPQYTHMRAFNTNFTGDFILFLTTGSDIKILNIIAGDYIGEIEGANFKGTCNFGLISDESPDSSLKETLTKIHEKFLVGGKTFWFKDCRGQTSGWTVS